MRMVDWGVDADADADALVGDTRGNLELMGSVLSDRAAGFIVRDLSRLWRAG